MGRRKNEPVKVTTHKLPSSSLKSPIAPRSATSTESFGPDLAPGQAGNIGTNAAPASGKTKSARSHVRPVVAIIPSDLDEVYRVAKAVLVARLAPACYTQERGIKLPNEEVIARLVIGIIKGSELGFPPITALSTIAIIDKKPCVYGDGATALIQSRGHLDSMLIEEVGTIPAATVPIAKFADGYGIRVTLRRRGQPEPYIGQFTVGDAKRARLWLDPHREPWIKYPRRQLKWRAFAWPARDGFADDLMGLGIAEEMLDLPPDLAAKTNLGFLDDKPDLAVPMSISGVPTMTERTGSN